MSARDDAKRAIRGLVENVIEQNLLKPLMGKVVSKSDEDLEIMVFGLFDKGKHPVFKWSQGIFYRYEDIQLNLEDDVFIVPIQNTFMITGKITKDLDKYLSASKSTYKSMTLRWRKIGGADSYDIRYRPVYPAEKYDFLELDEMDTFHGEHTHHMDQHLHNIPHAHSDPPLETSTGGANPDISLPPIPPITRPVRPTTASTIDPDNERMEEIFRFFIEELDVPWQYVTGLSSETLETTITSYGLENGDRDLIANTEYECQYRAIINGRKCPWSNSIGIETIVFEAPHNFRSMETSGGVSFNWDEIPGVEGYELEVEERI